MQTAGHACQTTRRPQAEYDMGLRGVRVPLGGATGDWLIGRALTRKDIDHEVANNCNCVCDENGVEVSEFQFQHEHHMQQ